MTERLNNAGFLSRRQALTACSMSLSGLALHGMLHAETEGEQRASFDMKPRAPGRPAKANAVIQLFQNGGPSQMELFDPKPAL